MLSGPDRSAFVGSALIHLLALLLVWWSHTASPAPDQFVAYDIQLVSPPSPTEGVPQPKKRLTVETPKEEKSAAEETKKEAPPPPEPKKEEPKPEAKKEEKKAPPEPAEETPAPKEKTAPPKPADKDQPKGSSQPVKGAKTSGENINVRIEGLRRDYPAYYENIIRQIHRCFRWRGSQDLAATVRFYIHRDGTVSDLSVVQRSGNVEFDFEAMGAVECAGNEDRLGPLPKELPYDRLPIEFTFRPAGG